MTREEIINLAREAHEAMLATGHGMHVWHGDAYLGDVQKFCEHFAALVAKAERKRCIQVCNSIADAMIGAAYAEVAHYCAEEILSISD